MFQLVNVRWAVGKIYECPTVRGNLLYLSYFFSHFFAPVCIFIVSFNQHLFESLNKIDQQTFVGKNLLTQISKCGVKNKVESARR